MLDADIVLAKIATIRRCLQRIRDVTGMDPDRLDDINVQDIFVLNLERAAQAAIDLASHVIAANAWGLAESLADHFTILETRGVIGREITRRMRAMVGFRNIAVHDYASLDPAILKAILVRHLADLEEFAAAIVPLLSETRATNNPQEHDTERTREGAG